MRQNQSIIKYDACDHPFADAAEAIGRKPNRNQALVVSLAGAAARREKLK
jgi:hypothetical protein